MLLRARPTALAPAAAMVPRHGVLGETKPWSLACDLRTSCLSRRGVALWTLVRGLKAASEVLRPTGRQGVHFYVSYVQERDAQ